MTEPKPPFEQVVPIKKNIKMASIQKDIYQEAAVIGMWRCGAETIQIAVITGLYERVVERIIKEYQTNKK